MRLRFDETKCTGHGRCYVTAPELFTDDDRGFGQVTHAGTVTPDLADRAGLAVEACPERAIVLA